MTRAAWGYFAGALFGLSLAALAVWSERPPWWGFTCCAACLLALALNLEDE